MLRRVAVLRARRRSRRGRLARRGRSGRGAAALPARLGLRGRMQAAEAHGLALRMSATAACSTTRHIDASRGRVLVSLPFPTHGVSNGWTVAADVSDLVDR